MPILVSYATSNGSTRTVAERIALRLSQQLAPAEVDCVPAATAPLLSSAEGKKYSAVVIGSAVHAGYWIGPGRRFLKQNGPYLSSGAEGVAPVWAFSVGMPPTDDDLAKEQAMLEKRLRSHLTGETLRGHHLFRGVFAKTDLPWVMRVMFTCCVPEDKTRFGDSRDWPAIEGWADEVGAAMREAGVVGRPSTN